MRNMKLNHEKLARLRELEKLGYIREDCPEPDDYGNVAFWRFSVIVKYKLPVDLLDEFNRNGEIRV